MVEAASQTARLPGIAKKTALRLVLRLVRAKEERTLQLTEALNRLRTQIRFCRTCHNISDDEECAICRAPKRDRNVICVVEDVRDVMAIANTTQYNGLYHVPGGVLSPVNEISPG